MRCVSITSWPTAEISAGGASCCSFSDEHRLGGLEQVGRLAVDRAQRLADLVSIFCCAMHDAGVLLGAVDQRQQRRRARPARRPARPATVAVAGLQAAHVARQHLGALLAPRGRPAALPISACDTDLASRCDCISAWPVAATCAAPRSADAERHDRSGRSGRPGRGRAAPSRMRCCSAAGRLPISGSAGAERRGAGVGALQAGLGEVGDLGRRRLGDDRARSAASAAVPGSASNAAPPRCRRRAARSVGAIERAGSLRVGVGDGDVAVERLGSADALFWPQPLILFTKLIWTSVSSQRPLSRRCAGTDSLPRQRGQVQLLPDARRRRRGSARRRRPGASPPSSPSRRQLARRCAGPPAGRPAARS